MPVYQDLLQNRKSMAVIGLGYVGLPVALAFAKKVKLIAFDENTKRISQLQLGIDPNKEVDTAAFAGADILFTGDTRDLQQAIFYLIAVPTPVDENKIPDLSHLKRAVETVGKHLKQGDYIVFESTVYPGCTEEECIPLLENISGLRCYTDFKVGYSPERINPGDKIHGFANTVKVVAGCDAESLQEITSLYELVVTAGVHQVQQIKIAEASKIVENTQRDLNISLMNELSVIFDKLGISTGEVLEAAATKWNFMKFTPGLVGGHCIDVDPYYLTHKAKQLGYQSKVIAAGRVVNDAMPHYISKKIVQHIMQHTALGASAKVLVLGATFKENVRDIRNSKVMELVKDLLDYSLQVDFIDAHAEPAEVERMYGLQLAAAIGENYDAVVLAVAHDVYTTFTEGYLLAITRPNALFADLKGIYRNKITKLAYWSL